jgi:hypothetical protein
MGNILPETKLTDIVLKQFLGKYIVINIINNITVIHIFDGNDIIYTVCTGYVFESVAKISGVLEIATIKWQEYYYPGCLPGDYNIELGHELCLKIIGMKTITMTANSGWRISTGKYP